MRKGSLNHLSALGSGYCLGIQHFLELQALILIYVVNLKISRRALCFINITF